MTEVFVKLWDSIFTPGVTPALIAATHVTCALLLLTLSSLFLYTWNYHFLALFLIASALWASVTWFIKELEASTAASSKDNNKKEK
ncbi:hypothetical protein CANCADRAFT_24012 [Tortispora caseinolytica NRRL Y-17796]|uniref:Uncharacterized protein n=1 Tax=Tortispora caseinolytica NRRL Y-17796 TaxID=767744 RepID=A0A1E4TDY6_9ASCO|nr:hypothetical protein CANCADRAFT_24012 [Tortispora caseinolytica NRRL Y-17796]